MDGAAFAASSPGPHPESAPRPAAPVNTPALLLQGPGLQPVEGGGPPVTRALPPGKPTLPLGERLQGEPGGDLIEEEAG